MDRNIHNFNVLSLTFSLFISYQSHFVVYLLSFNILRGNKMYTDFGLNTGSYVNGCIKIVSLSFCQTFSFANDKCQLFCSHL